MLTLPADPDMLRFNLIHRRLGHAGFQTIHNMVVGGMVEGLKLTPRQLKSMPSYRLHAADCVCCKLAKMHASPHKTSQHQVSRPLQEVHMDVAGPHVDLGRCKEAYYLMLVDVYSNAVWVACFKTRDQVPQLVHQGLLSLQAEAKTQVAVIRSDNAAEFISQELADLILPMQRG